MWARCMSAALLGLPLSVGLIGLIALAWPGDPRVTTLPWVMMAFPTWVAMMTLAFVFRSAKRAWLWLGGATAACFVLLYGLQALGWIGVPA
ncbi:hypothetical protein RHOFW510R12_00100 [Rhodanobacter sp. FW510-R12]|nr:MULTISPECIES: hypothetical protein [unclassified Rhodanobacter]KZC15604.1 hypothetical protein RHOFW104R8_04145 [Rhodanobacter sp. FW104-R8]KZC28309.1 hypothetical protein RhoFW510T8_11655 [Rhodanobacter sp. FW510-T8]KZC32684.1 hypothetical protein RhoFW510R10_11175 [Rhodanobacter sp. FW510-R10]